MTKTYYYEENCEFAEGLGTIYTEFIGQVATRQISIIGSKAYLSSLAQDFYEKDFLLYDGDKDELDLSGAQEISEEVFDQAWLELMTEEGMESRLDYQVGDASLPLKPGTLIIHVVNGLGKWGKGFVLPLGKRYPQARESYQKWAQSGSNFSLGNVDFCLVDEESKAYVANMLAQEEIKKHKEDPQRYVDYQALEDCLNKVADFALLHHLSVQCPMIGAGLAGGDWETVSKMLVKTLCAKKISCTVLTLAK